MSFIMSTADGLPIGTIKKFSGDPNWRYLEANGQSVNIADYRPLFAVQGHPDAGTFIDVSFPGSLGTGTAVLGIDANGTTLVSVGSGGAAGQGFAARSVDNGDNWVSDTFPNQPQDLTDVAFGASLFVMIGQQGLINSSPGTGVWTQRQNDNQNYILNNILWDGTQFLAGGGKFGITPPGSTWAGAVVRSTNGTSWARTYTGTAGQAVEKIVEGVGGHVALLTTNTDIIRSIDGGLNWVPVSLPANFSTVSSDIAHTFHTGISRHVIVGRDTVAAEASVIYSDDDGATWTKVNLPGVVSGGSFVLTKVGFGNGLLIAEVGVNSAPVDIITSSDAVTWSSVKTVSLLGNTLTNAPIDFQKGIWFMPGNESGTEEGLFESFDAATSWVFVEDTSDGVDFPGVLFWNQERYWVLGREGTANRAGGNYLPLLDLDHSVQFNIPDIPPAVTENPPVKNYIKALP